MRLNEVNEAKFISSIHNVSVGKMDQLLKAKTTKQQESTELSGTDKEQRNQSTTAQSASETVSMSEPSASLQQSQRVEVYVPVSERVQVKNPLFKIENRERMLDILFEDVIRTYEPDENINIFAYKSEDYLDSIRKVTEIESVSLDVRIAHDLMRRWVHYIKPLPEKEGKKKKKREFKQGKAHASVFSIQEVSRPSQEVSVQKPA